MRIRKQGIERRTVIEAYTQYDCSKTGRPIPDFSTWNWSQADAIDAAMRRAHLKVGIPAGYLQWDQIELSISDLRECAVDVNVFPGQSRKLGYVESAGVLVGWKPDRSASWYESIVTGQTSTETAPFLIRPAVQGELPARWYIEDGSGRGIAFVANEHLFDASQIVAIGYLGREPDRHSLFMQQHFRELL